MRIGSLLKLTVYVSLSLVAGLALAMGWVALKIGETRTDIAITGELDKALKERVILRNDFYVRGEERARLQVLDKSEQVTAILGRAKPRFMKLAEAELLDQIIRRNANLTELLRFYFDAVERHSIQETARKQSGEYEKRLFSQILVKGFLLDADVQLLEAAHRNKLKLLDSVLNLLVIGAFLVLVSMVLVEAWWIAGRLTRSVERLRQGAARIGGGDLGARLPEIPSDEIADVAREINTMAASLSTSFTAIRKLQDEASRRNLELEVANKELEAFSYSVAHDLRAPLRSIDGFACILQEEYAKVLGPEGRRLLGIIRSSSQKMDALTQDLLELTKVGKVELKLTMVDMHALAIEAFSLCADPKDLAGFDFTVQELPTVLADLSMMQQVWVNLLSNAVKYSGHSNVHRVDVQGIVGDGMSVYSVHDHGTGFDQRYAGKLFGMFQRLHDSDEFQGTGIGLSIVKKIVERHGGRVWAEGRVGKGATFHFSIPTGG